MKHTLVTLGMIASLALGSCGKEHSMVHNDVQPTGGTARSSANPGLFARFSGPNYSQPIPKDSANKMVLSYLSSVGYPAVDTALRALTFDADTLRSYLADSSITTIKFMLAHKLAYINNGGNGVRAGLNPNAITLVLVGLTTDDQYVLNKANRVYDNFNPCPAQCPNTSSTFIQ